MFLLHCKSPFISYDNISCHLVCLYVLLIYTNERHHSHLVKFGLEETENMEQTSTEFKEKISILQPLSKPNLEIKSKTNQDRKCQFL